MSERTRRVHESHKAKAWQRRYDQLAKVPGVSTVVRSLPSGKTLPLAYVRSGPRASTPILVLPGGPGLASVLPYRMFRADAAKRDLDVLMVEHRGVGMSRKAKNGADLEPSEITVATVLADLVAVLDAEGLDQVIVYGSSYGSYLAGAFGARHPGRIAGMVLDSAVLDAANQRAATKRLNQLYWHGTPSTSDDASRVRALVASGALAAATAGFPLQFLHEYGGPQAVASMLALRERGKGARVWEWIRRLGAADVMQSRPFVMEFDLVGRIAFTELDYGAAHDPADGPLRADEGFADLATRFPPFDSEPCDLHAALPSFDWPTFVVSGDRDIRTPRATAEEIVADAPHARLVPVRDHGHSALDAAPHVALAVLEQLARQGADARDDAATAGVLDLAGRPSVIGRLLSTRLTLAKSLPGEAELGRPACSLAGSRAFEAPPVSDRGRGG